MSADPTNLAAIAFMAVLTLATRLAGALAVRGWTPKGRAAAAVEAVPAAVLASVIAPTVVATGPAETLAALAAVIAATRLPLIGTVTVGVLAVVSLRAAL